MAKWSCDLEVHQSWVTPKPELIATSNKHHESPGEFRNKGFARAKTRLERTLSIVVGRSSCESKLPGTNTATTWSKRTDRRCHVEISKLKSYPIQNYKNYYSPTNETNEPGITFKERQRAGLGTRLTRHEHKHKGQTNAKTIQTTLHYTTMVYALTFSELSTLLPFLSAEMRWCGPSRPPTPAPSSWWAAAPATGGRAPRSDGKPCSASRPT